MLFLLSFFRILLTTVDCSFKQYVSIIETAILPAEALSSQVRYCQITKLFRHGLFSALKPHIKTLETKSDTFLCFDLKQWYLCYFIQTVYSLKSIWLCCLAHISDWIFLSHESRDSRSNESTLKIEQIKTQSFNSTNDQSQIRSNSSSIAYGKEVVSKIYEEQGAHFLCNAIFRLRHVWTV